jgi:xylulokinase
VAFSFRDCLEAIKQHTVRVGEIRATGGGAQSRLWTSILAAVVGQPIVVMGANAGGASFGAAILGGVCAGAYASVPEACASLVGRGVRIEPDSSKVRAYEGYFQVFRSLYPLLKEPYRQLAELT